MNKQNYFVLALLAFCCFTACNSKSPNQTNGAMPTNQGGGYQIGDTVEDFSLKNVDNAMISLSDYKNKKGLIIIFTCNHCPFAKAYEDRIIMLHKNNEANYPVLAINPNNPELEPEDGFEEMKNRATEKGFPFKYLMDEKQEIFPKFGATKTPEVFLLKIEDGEFILRYKGTIDDNYQDAESVQINYIENAIKSLENGAPVTPSTTKAIGCGIKK